MNTDLLAATYGPKHETAIESQASGSLEEFDILVMQHGSYMLCIIVYDAFSIESSGLPIRREI